MTAGSLVLGFVYYLAALLCLGAFKSKKKSPDTRGRLRAHADAVRSFLLAVAKRGTHLPELARAAAPWLALAILLALVGFVRQLNLQVLLTQTFQTEAIVEGWYDARRARQLQIVSGMAAGAALTIGVLMILLRRRLSDVGLPMMAFVMLVLLLAVRTVSNHQIDAVLLEPMLGVPPAYALELLLLAVISATALRSSRRRPPKPTAPLVARIEP